MPVRILLLEDVATDAELVQRELRRDGIAFVATRVETREAFLAQVDGVPPDIILADYSLPRFNALEALHLLREKDVHVPFILVTGATSEERAVECMREGADDYILKTSLKRLPKAFLNVLAKHRAERERERVEEALVQREQRFRALIENASDVITILDTGARVVYQSPSVERVLGYNVETLTGRVIFDLVHKDDLNRVLYAFSLIVDHPGALRTIEFRMKHRDGSWRTLESVASYIPDNPSVSGVIVNSRDITERKRAEITNAALSLLGQRLSSARTPGEAARIIVGVAQELFGWDACSLSLYDEDLDAAVSVLMMDIINGKKMEVAQTVHGGIPSAMMRRTLRDGGQLVLRGKTEPVPELHPFGDMTRTSASLMFVPIRNGDRGIGVLSIQSYTPEAFTLEDLATLQALADHCGAALERIRAEFALRDSEQRYRIMAEQTGQLVYDYDVITGQIRWSGAIEDVVGYTQEEFASVDIAGWEGHIHPQDLGEATGMLNAAMKEGGKYTVEYRFRRKDGMYIYVEDNGIFLINEFGRAYKMLGTMKDISERKRAQDALQQSEERYRVVAETAVDVIITIDEQGTIQYVNRAAGEIFGYAIHELTGTSVAMLMPEYLHHTAYKELVGPAGTPHTRVEISGLHKDGTRIPLEVSSAEFFLQGRRYFTGIVRDISERKRAEQAQRRSDEQYKRFFEDDLTGDFIADGEGAITACNPAFARMFGYASVSAAQQASMLSRYPSPEAYRGFLAELQQCNSLEYYELELRRTDGKPVFVVANVYALFDAQGALTEMRGYLFDDTERRKLEDQLRQAQKMESIGTLASGIAHDFNNVLNNILGFSMQIKKYLHDPVKIQKYGETIEKSARRGAELATQLLSFVRQRKRQNTPTDLGGIVQEIVSLSQDTFPANIIVRNEVDSMLFPVLGDRGELYQVLSNLCLNAKDAMPDGGTLTIEAANRTIGRDVSPKLILNPGQFCVELRITDTGFGIPEQVRDKIFDPFFTTKERGHGTGLGLAIVFGIVRNHKGSVLVSSEVGKGTTFMVYLPAIEGIIPDAHTEPVAPPPVRGNGEIVLMVDDDQNTRELGRELLEENGFRVLMACDGVEALEVFRERHREIALVIIDLVMPRMDGGQTYVELKAIDPALKAFFCTGFASDQVIAPLLAEEHLRSLPKPFNTTEFIRTVHEVMNGNHSRH